MSPIFHPLRVRSIEPDTAEAVIVAFDVPPDLRQVFGFTQGQHLTLRADIDGQDLRRAYSICAGIDDGQLRVGVRKVAGGRFSHWLHTRLRVGDTLQVMAPQGRFFVPLQPAAQRHYLGIAGGSGITPILSIMKTALAREPRSRFTLIYGNRSLQSTMFREELQDLKNRYLARLALHHVFSAEQTDMPLNMGRIDHGKITAFLDALLPVRRIDAAFICGPFQMNDQVQAALLAAGLPAERIHVERFGLALPAGAQADAVMRQALAGDAHSARITIVRDGLRREFRFTREQASILDAASAAGLELPFACTSGVCGTCRARCLQGRVRMERNFALDQADLDAGFVLSCQCRPLTDSVVLSFDER
ncbi:1,2-phenylacetyl-CoA epoxidase subunit PaaE [Verminephrobacter eiseniae]|uniref:1,2-phenylacetyl-CoA epoxidase subunit PaaE n=1 Tax=Verminephrobacter eiseniae TaxID=364317 RepID=UPI00223702F9|nr:1,2-phenylacetyl-CoA epoxidase subunit PaaE [Verminephrobacter eiseniae]MCW5237182.1 phenylacetate-CoA oxygenase/reductase subunit PaaK [Verminephrobacter eiseniae]